MGFTEKLAGMLKKKGARTREPIPLKSLNSFINQEISEEERRIAEECSGFVEAINDGMKELSDFLEKLREMEREEMFKKLDMIVRNSQKRFADSLGNVIKRVHLDTRDYEGLTKFHNHVTDALEQMAKLTRMHGRYLYMAFDKEMKTFSKTVKTITIYNNFLGKTLHSEGNIIAQLISIQKMFSEMEKMKVEMATADKERLKIEENIGELEEDILKFRKNLDTLQSSEEYESLVRTKRQHELLVSDLKSIEGEIYNVLHPLDRDFRKFKKQVELGNFPFDVRLLEKYEQLTEQFLREEEGYPHLKKIAEKMREALQNQVIKEKGHEKDKVIDILEFILKDGLLELQRRYHAVEAQLDSEPEKSDIFQKMEAVKKEVEEKTHRIVDLKAKEKDFNSRKKDAEESIQRMEEKIREKCEDIGILVE